MSAAPVFSRAPALVEVDGVSTPAEFAGLEPEVGALRGSVGLSWMPHVACLRLSGPAMWDVLDRICPADLYLRDLQLKHTLLLDDLGLPFVDLHVGNDDDSFVLLAEGVPQQALLEHIRAHAPAGADFALTDVRSTHSLIALNGPFAWEALAALEGPEIIGFPYLTFYHPRDTATYFRAGKTGEYGYELLVPHEEAPGLWKRLVELGAQLDLREVGVNALRHASFESWFFDIHREGREQLSPIELQLNWRLSTEDKDYVGRAALRGRNVTRRLTALESDEALRAGEPITYEGRPIGAVVRAERSVTLGHHIAIALIDLELAHSGIDRFRAGLPVRTVSAPFVNNLSLYVNPQQHSWATRHEVEYPGPHRRRR